MYLVLSALTSSPISLVAATKASAFSFNYLGNLISHDKEVDVDNKFNNYLKITCIINNMFRPEGTLNKTRINVYSALALPALSYFSENMTIEAGGASRLTAAEMKYVRKTVRHTGTVNKINTCIAKELKITPVLEKIQENGRKWLQDMNRMPHIGLPRILNDCRPTGRRNR